MAIKVNPERTFATPLERRFDERMAGGLGWLNDLRSRRQALMLKPKRMAKGDLASGSTKKSKTRSPKSAGTAKARKSKPQPKLVATGMMLEMLKVLGKDKAKEMGYEI